MVSPATAASTACWMVANCDGTLSVSARSSGTRRSSASARRGMVALPRSVPPPGRAGRSVRFRPELAVGERVARAAVGLVEAAAALGLAGREVVAGAEHVEAVAGRAHRAAVAEGVVVALDV